MGIKHYTQEEIEQLPSLTDPARLEAMTDEEVIAAAESDSDNPPLTAEQLSQMKPLREVLPWLGNRGRPVKEQTKVSVTIRLHPEVLAYFKAGGQGWQTRLNEALHEYIKQHPSEAA